LTATVTSDFRNEYETQRQLFLRRRVLWFTGMIAGFFALLLLWQTIMVAFGSAGVDRVFWIKLVVRSTNLALYGSAFVYATAHQAELTRRRMVWIVTALILTTAFLLYVPAQAVTAMLNALAHGSGNVGPSTNIGSLPLWLIQVMLLHIIASIFIPWTPKESLIPMIPVLVVHFFLEIFGSDTVVIKIVAITFANTIVFPGMALAWWRQSRFHARFHYRALRGRYKEMRRELTDAQRIHEAIFPSPINDGPVRFDYLYEPMRQIGGDFLFTHRHGDAQDSPLSVVIIDVTGHGIPAALTVNRLHGELQRLFAENPGLTPGEALEAINRYVFLTMAEHSVFATALCLRINPRQDTLEYANGGHPPAFVRTIDGLIDQLDSTTFVLGVVHDWSFTPGQRSIRFGPGDALVAYTDGATETIDATGRMLCIEGVRRVIASDHPQIERSLGHVLLEAVNAHRQGPVQDDTLVVEIRRPLVKPTPRRSARLTGV